jgi:hypothetical protein
MAIGQPVSGRKLGDGHRISRHSLAAETSWLGVLGSLGVLAVRFLKLTPPNHKEHQEHGDFLEKRQGLAR